MVAASAAVGGGGSCEGSCIICFDGDPRPIQSGCACRGDAGLAHVECRAMDAAHRMKNRGQFEGWWRCGTCKQRFTTAMRLGLACAWWSTAQQLPEEDEQRLRAAGNLAIALDAQGKHTEAEILYREVLAVRRRVQGPEHPRTLAMAMNLAASLDDQGKYVEAETMYRDMLVVQRRVLGPEHPHTLTTAGNLASSLYRQGKYVENETMNRDVLAVRQRVLGPEHPETLRTAGNLANALNSQGKHIEAERMFHDVLVVQRRVLGPEHPDTLWTTEKLEACVRFARGTRGSAK
jgi:tetratricopeptide (TPR) repeat protein